MILVVDDDLETRQALAAFFEAKGYAVALADSARRGLEVIGEAWPDLIVLDLTMPEMSGWDFLAALRRIHNPAPVVIVFTGIQAQVDGVAATVWKPNVEGLLQAVERHHRQAVAR